MKRPDGKQRGVVLLLLLLVFMIAGTSLMLGTFNIRQDINVGQQLELSNQLQLAKEALLAYAANSSAIHGNTRGPGFFPCPDTTNTGEPDADCASSSVNLGRLPQYVEVGSNKIFMNAYYADANRQFWYAIAPRYTYAATTLSDRRAVNRISADSVISSSRLTLDETDNIVALIIAPGDALDFQDRTAASLAAGNFLEGGNEDVDENFFSVDAANPDAFNDQMIAITHNELMAYIGRSAAMEIKRVLDADFALQPAPGRYPVDPYDPAQSYDEFADTISDHPWLTGDSSGNSELWALDTIYTVSSATQVSLQFSGCTNMTFILDHDAGITSNGNSC